jgi:hypothetical protein
MGVGGVARVAGAYVRWRLSEGRAATVGGGL